MRIEAFQGLRFYFAALIFVSHYCGFVIPKSWEFGGECGVSFFFALSGFVLSLSYDKRRTLNETGTAKTLVERLKRLYPLHVITFAVTYALDLRLGTQYSLSQILCNLLLVQCWTGQTDMAMALNGVSWFLCDILFFYLVFERLHRFLFRLQKQGVWAVLLTVFLLYPIVVSCFACDNAADVIYFFPLLRLTDFALGILTYRLFRAPFTARVRSKLDIRPKHWETGLEITALALLLAVYAVWNCTPEKWHNAILFLYIMPVIIYTFALTHSRPGAISKILSHRAMRSLGSVSYEFYMTQLVVMRVLRHFLPNQITDQMERTRTLADVFTSSACTTFFVVSFITAIVVSYILHRVLAFGGKQK